VKPFLLLASRAEDRAADEEYAAFLRFGGLTPDLLHRHRLEAESMPDVDFDAYAGIILGGSPFTTSVPQHTKSPAQVRVEAELGQLMKEVVARDFPFLGACYGIGVLGLAVGAVVDGTYPEPVGPAWITLTQEGRRDPLLGVLPERCEVFLGHKEAITTLPDHAVVLAASEACPVQAFRVGRNVYATQFHPELDVPGIQTRIDIYKDEGYFLPETAEDLKAAAALSAVTHPPLIAKRFVELFG
jgi:GMP synthase (glutamine-hydrolysing)